MTRDMTSGSPLKSVIQFCIPLFLGMLFQQLYNMVDTMIVGRALGLDALAGVGSTSSLNGMIVGTCTGITAGFAVPVTQAFGARDHRALRRYVTGSAWLTAAISLVVTVTVVLLCKQILIAMKTPANALQYAYDYMVVVFAGIPFILLYNLCVAIIRALGDSRSPLFFLIVSSILNILLDLLFILVFQWGVTGAALATVLAQGVSGIACLVHMRRHFPILLMQREDWRIEWPAMQRLMVIGLPMGLQVGITSAGGIVVQTAFNSFGEHAVAGIAAAQKIYGVLTAPLEALGATMATYVGQNVGARKMDRVSLGVKQATILGLAMAAVILVLTLLFGTPMLRLLLGAGEADAVAFGRRFMLTSMCNLVFLTGVLVYRFSLQGMGYAHLAMLAGVFETIARFFVAYGLANWFGYAGVCFSNPLAWSMADLFLIPAYVVCLRRLKRRFAAELPAESK
ncbi:MAG: MATE family efflux transporter [Ruminococcaceae bacterium]|nr:MATE family efflux transporter [Oscillospiraceae bacterium]